MDIQRPQLNKKLFQAILLAIVLLLAGFGFNWLNLEETQAASGINTQLNYQGKLTSTAGTQVADGNWNFRFRIYDASAAGTLLWTERWTSTTTQAATVNGIFSVALGSLGQTDLLSGLDWNSDSLYLQVDLDADGNGTWEESFATRKRLTSSAYAFNADMLDGYNATTTAAASGTIPVFDANLTLNLFEGGVSSTMATTTNLYVGNNATTTGRVVIGNINPTNDYGGLWVGGDIYTSGAASTTGSLYVGEYASSTGGLFTQGDGHIGGNLTIDGNVGIATTTPGGTYEEKLTIVGDAYIIGLIRIGTSTDFVTLNSNPNTYGPNIQAASDKDLTIRPKGAGNVIFFSPSYLAGVITYGSATTTGGLMLGVDPATTWDAPTSTLMVNGSALFTGNATTSGTLTVVTSDSQTATANMYIDGNGLIHLATSARRFKTDIDYSAVNGDWVYQMKPAAFKEISTNNPYFGFIAEDMAAIDPRFASYDASGQVLGVEWNAVASALTAAIQNLHQQVSDLSLALDVTSAPTAAEPLTVIDNPDLGIKTLAVGEAATFYGTIYVQGEAGFESQVVFNQDIEVKGKIYASADQAGTAVILANSTSMEITFVKEYEITPKIVATARKPVALGIMDQTIKGFRVFVNEPVAEDLIFDWIALAVKDSGIVAGAELPSEPVLGCLDSAANNYNPSATQDDGSCEYPPAVEPVAETPPSESPATESAVEPVTEPVAETLPIEPAVVEPAPEPAL